MMVDIYDHSWCVPGNVHGHLMGCPRNPKIRGYCPHFTDEGTEAERGGKLLAYSPKLMSQDFTLGVWNPKNTPTELCWKIEQPLGLLGLDF